MRKSNFYVSYLFTFYLSGFSFHFLYSYCIVRFNNQLQQGWARPFCAVAIIFSATYDSKTSKMLCRTMSHTPTHCFFLFLGIMEKKSPLSPQIQRCQLIFGLIWLISCAGLLSCQTQFCFHSTFYNTILIYYCYFSFPILLQGFSKQLTYKLQHKKLMSLKTTPRMKFLKDSTMQN